MFEIILFYELLIFNINFEIAQELPSKMNVCLVTQVVDTSNIVKFSKKIKTVIDPNARRPKCELSSTRLSSECGFLVRLMTPLWAKKWKRIDLDDKMPIMTFFTCKLVSNFVNYNILISNILNNLFIYLFYRQSLILI